MAKCIEVQVPQYPAALSRAVNPSAFCHMLKFYIASYHKHVLDVYVGSFHWLSRIQPRWVLYIILCELDIFRRRWLWAVFTARRVCIARTMPWQDVCPLVRLSHAGILSKQLYIVSQKTRQLRIMWHNFANSQHLLIIFGPYSILNIDVTKSFSIGV